jgi:hypothetical protein
MLGQTKSKSSDYKKHKIGIKINNELKVMQNNQLAFFSSL